MAEFEHSTEDDRGLNCAEKGDGKKQKFREEPRGQNTIK